jgi:hypothetical protein
MTRRITGSLVSKGDLVTFRSKQLRFDYSLADQKTHQGREIGIVTSTVPSYDRIVSDGDCFVFWAHTNSIVRESSQYLHILSAGKHKGA